MSLAARVENYLCQAHINYDVIHHRFTDSAYDSACAAHLTVSNVVKAVLLKQNQTGQYLIAAIPASNKLNIDWVNAELQGNFSLAEEHEIAAQFPDCVLGAIPGLAQAHKIDLIWDDQLERQRELYFEAGNHQELIHISPVEFKWLFKNHAHSVISLPAENYSQYHTDEMRGADSH